MADLSVLGLRGDLPQTSRSRAERIVAVSRLVLAVFTVLAIFLDPTQPTRHAETTYVLLLGYTVYSALLALLVFSARAPQLRLGLATHVTDLVLFTVFMYLTEGPTSPLFIFFTFALVAATLRWRWRGALWTAAASLAAYNGLALYATQVLHDPSFPLNRFIIRNLYIAVIAVLLAYLGAYESGLRRELAALAAWPRQAPAALDALLREVLSRAASALGSPRVLLAWEDPDEPWMRLALWYRGKLGAWREPPESYAPLVAEPLRDRSFGTPDAGATEPEVWHTAASGVVSWRGSPVHPELQVRFAIGGLVSVPLHSDVVSGRLFALDRRGLTVDDLMLAEIVARQVAGSLEHFYLSGRLRTAAASEERVRLSRDLHDGVLQSLTGAALQLRTAERLMEREPNAARTLIGEIERLIADEQRDLRFFIQDLKPGTVGALEEVAGLEGALQTLARRLESVWDLRMELSPVPSLVRSASAGDIYRIIQEASVNAARHGKASEVRVGLVVDDGTLAISVADNGCGFPFHGRFDHTAIEAVRHGPRTLRERVVALGGTLAIESSGAGSRLDIRIPMAADGG
jgi:signal transduction histidine kinase